MVFPISITTLGITFLRVVGRVVTATGTVSGISLLGIVFPKPPSHKAGFRAQKTASLPVALLLACYPPVIELLHSQTSMLCLVLMSTYGVMT